MNSETLQLDSSLLAGRLRTYERQPIEPTPRGRVELNRPGAVSDFRIQTKPASALPAARAVTETVVHMEEVEDVVEPVVIRRVDRTTPKLAKELHKTTARSTVLQGTTQPVNFIERSLQWQETHPKAKGFSLKSLKESGKMLYVMAAIVFLFGVGASVHSIFTDKKIVGTANAQALGPDAEENQPTDGDLAAYMVAPDMPRFIKIEKLNVKARVLQVGVDKQNAVLAPANIFDAGWYRDSAKPGSADGAAVIDGHVSGPTKNGIFYDAKKLVAGDKIVIERGDGKEITYQVVKSQQFDANSTDMNPVMEQVNPSKPGLNIVTCAGTFNRATQKYEQRLVVFAEQV